jgi:hypothetical protein
METIGANFGWMLIMALSILQEVLSVLMETILFKLHKVTGITLPNTGNKI